mmetsp:Transcript_39800/g.102503  ORF Transcript_39800/g.102503 Transcript_39800/m.102503 type:complete len:2057 (-) Transcript_39800:731-6901(-)|eukprot:CAMPEP_0113867502 /NCGR_PEP_ID=MMETSP0780_2-20120614/456_1 /TAXON_ID=652834 /ORGANISM="Palpitomonas bilix" /LENGTH=2056 /DNA_ID=CAMNT_0000852455 /DNA_START=1106 /DNA_END=7276 /DNA_ORIENTATION=+ /assembly_acc=CAM_ASM_000599
MGSVNACIFLHTFASGDQVSITVDGQTFDNTNNAYAPGTTLCVTAKNRTVRYADLSAVETVDSANYRFLLFTSAAPSLDTTQDIQYVIQYFGKADATNGLSTLRYDVLNTGVSLAGEVPVITLDDQFQVSSVSFPLPNGHTAVNVSGLEPILSNHLIAVNVIKIYAVPDSLHQSKRIEQASRTGSLTDTFRITDLINYAKLVPMYAVPQNRMPALRGVGAWSADCRIKDIEVQSLTTRTGTFTAAQALFKNSSNSCVRIQDMNGVFGSAYAAEEGYAVVGYEEDATKSPVMGVFSTAAMFPSYMDEMPVMDSEGNVSTLADAYSSHRINFKDSNMQIGILTLKLFIQPTADKALVLIPLDASGARDTTNQVTVELDGENDSLILDPRGVEQPWNEGIDYSFLAGHSLRVTDGQDQIWTQDSSVTPLVRTTQLQDNRVMITSKPSITFSSYCSAAAQSSFLGPHEDKNDSDEMSVTRNFKRYSKLANASLASNAGNVTLDAPALKTPSQDAIGSIRTWEDLQKHGDNRIVASVRVSTSLWTSGSQKLFRGKLDVITSKENTMENVELYPFKLDGNGNPTIQGSSPLLGDQEAEGFLVVLRPDAPLNGDSPLRFTVHVEGDERGQSFQFDSSVVLVKELLADGNTSVLPLPATNFSGSMYWNSERVVRKSTDVAVGDTVDTLSFAFPESEYGPIALLADANDTTGQGETAQAGENFSYDLDQSNSTLTVLANAVFTDNGVVDVNSRKVLAYTVNPTNQNKLDLFSEGFRYCIVREQNIYCENDVVPTGSLLFASDASESSALSSFDVTDDATRDSKKVDYLGNIVTKNTFKRTFPICRIKTPVPLDANPIIMNTTTHILIHPMLTLGVHSSRSTVEDRKYMANMNTDLCRISNINTTWTAFWETILGLANTASMKISSTKVDAYHYDITLNFDADSLKMSMSSAFSYINGIHMAFRFAFTDTDADWNRINYCLTIPEMNLTTSNTLLMSSGTTSFQGNVYIPENTSNYSMTRTTTSDFATWNMVWPYGNGDTKNQDIDCLFSSTVEEESTENTTSWPMINLADDTASGSIVLGNLVHPTDSTVVLFNTREWIRYLGQTIDFDTNCASSGSVALRSRFGFVLQFPSGVYACPSTTGAGSDLNDGAMLTFFLNFYRIDRSSLVVHSLKTDVEDNCPSSASFDTTVNSGVLFSERTDANKSRRAIVGVNDKPFVYISYSPNDGVGKANSKQSYTFLEITTTISVSGYEETEHISFTSSISSSSFSENTSGDLLIPIQIENFETSSGSTPENIGNIVADNSAGVTVSVSVKEQVDYTLLGTYCGMDSTTYANHVNDIFSTRPSKASTQRTLDTLTLSLSPPPEIAFQTLKKHPNSAANSKEVQIVVTDLIHSSLTGTMTIQQSFAQLTHRPFGLDSVVRLAPEDEYADETEGTVGVTGLEYHTATYGTGDNEIPWDVGSNAFQTLYNSSTGQIDFKITLDKATFFDAFRGIGLGLKSDLKGSFRYFATSDALEQTTDYEFVVANGSATYKSSGASVQASDAMNITVWAEQVFRRNETTASNSQTLGGGAILINTEKNMDSLVNYDNPPINSNDSILDLAGGFFYDDTTNNDLLRTTSALMDNFFGAGNDTVEVPFVVDPIAKTHAIGARIFTQTNPIQNYSIHLPNVKISLEKDGDKVMMVLKDEGDEGNSTIFSGVNYRIQVNGLTATSGFFTDSSSNEIYYSVDPTDASLVKTDPVSRGTLFGDVENNDYSVSDLSNGFFTYAGAFVRSKKTVQPSKVYQSQITCGTDINHSSQSARGEAVTTIFLTGSLVEDTVNGGTKLQYDDQHVFKPLKLLSTDPVITPRSFKVNGADAAERLTNLTAIHEAIDNSVNGSGQYTGASSWLSEVETILSTTATEVSESAFYGSECHVVIVRHFDVGVMTLVNYMDNQSFGTGVTHVLERVLVIPGSTTSQAVQASIRREVNITPGTANDATDVITKRFVEVTDTTSSPTTQIDGSYESTIATTNTNKYKLYTSSTGEEIYLGQKLDTDGVTLVDDTSNIRFRWNTSLLAYEEPVSQT